jgi:hypothetical protein
MTTAAHENLPATPDGPAPDNAPALHQEHITPGASALEPLDSAPAIPQTARPCATKNKHEDNGLSSGEDTAQGLKWKGLCQKYRQAIGEKAVKRLAETWGVRPEVLWRMEIGFDSGAYTFPMKNARGEIIGIRKRAYEDPQEKYAVTESANGLFIPAGKNSPLNTSCVQASSWGRAGASSDGAPARARGTQRLLPASVEVITEGESDLAAALTLGVCGIGRPGAREAAKEIVALFQGCLTACPCITADNDPEGNGVEGAEALADALVAAGVPCRVLTPPDGFKDLRQWFTQGGLAADTLRKAIDRQPIRWPAEDPPGFVQVPNRAIRRGLIAKIGLGPFALACVIQSFYSPNAKTYPPREELARLLDVAPGTVDRWKGVLAGAGIGKWKRGGTNRANEYGRVNFGPVRTGGKKRKKNSGNGPDFT